MRLLAEELVFVVGAEQEGEALEVVSQLAYVDGELDDGLGQAELEQLALDPLRSRL